MKAQRRTDMTAQQHRGAKVQRCLWRIVLAVCCLLLLAVAGAHAGEGKDLLIIVSNQVSQVTGDRILLGEVAQITGGSDAMREVVAAIDLGPAPRPGQERNFTGRSVTVAVEKTLGAGGEVRMDVPDRVVARGACQTLSEAALEEAFRRHVTIAVGEDEVAISQIKVRGLKSLPTGRVSLTLSTPLEGEIKGRTTLRLAVAVDGEDCGQVTVSGWVDRYAQVLCTARDVSRNTILSAEDLCLKRMNIAEAPDRLVFHVADAVGKRVRSTIQEGKCLQQHKLFEVPLVERGERVKLLVSMGVVNVSTLGVAKTDGVAGDQIRVENLSSGKTVVGRILDDATVEVLF